MSQTHFPHRVYAKVAWSDRDWTLVDGLWCDRFQETLAPSIGQAHFSYRAGRQIRFGQRTWAEWDEPLGGQLGFFLKVELDQPGGNKLAKAGRTYNWYGYLTSSQRVRHGGDVSATDRQGQLTAHALEYLLQQWRITESVVEGKSPKINDSDLRIGEGLTFNGGGRGSRDFVPNRSVPFVAAAGAHAFAADLATAVPWNAAHMVAYLAKNVMPPDPNTGQPLPWKLDVANSDLALLRRATPVIETDERTVFDVLTAICERRRGYSWRVVVDAGEQLGLQVCQLDSQPIAFGPQDLVGGNPRLRHAHIDHDPGARRPTLTRQVVDVYQRVKVRGERLGHVFTLRYGTNLEADWLEADETAYNAAAPDPADNQNLPQSQAADLVYRSDDRFARLWRYYKIPPTWNGRYADNTLVLADPFHTEAPPPGFVRLPTGQFTPAQSAPIDLLLFPPPAQPLPLGLWWPGVRLENYLPLAPGDAEPTARGGLYRKPFGVIHDGTRWQHFERLAAPSPDAATLADLESATRPTLALAMRDDVAGILVTVEGAPQHYIAQVDFEAGNSFDAAGHKAALNWRELRATVYLQHHQHLEMSYPENLRLGSELVIHAAGHYLDLLPKGTVTGIDSAGELVTAAADRYVRDDRAQLLRLARIAFAWYSRPRQTLRLTRHTLELDAQPGDILATIGDDREPVDTPITSLEVDLVDGSYTLETDFIELDPRAF